MLLPNYGPWLRETGPQHPQVKRGCRQTGQGLRLVRARLQARKAGLGGRLPLIGTRHPLTRRVIRSDHLGVSRNFTLGPESVFLSVSPHVPLEASRRQDLSCCLDVVSDPYVFVD